MQRFALRDDQWQRIKDMLPGREGHVGGSREAEIVAHEGEIPFHLVADPGKAL